jgi:hypothetical protein
LLRKYASLQVLEAWRVPAQAGREAIRKSAHRVEFDYQPRAGYLYVRSRMISSRTNDNHDTFPAREIEAGYKTFLGKPVFVNHHNANHRRARGVIVAVALHRDRNADRTPDIWVEGLMEIDAVRFPKLCKAILAGKVNRTSMGVDVEWSRCSACGNKATSPAEYCHHLPAMKGKKIRKTNPKTGKVEERLIHEVCAGLSFFENSLLVEDPADPTAYLLGKPDARGLGKAAAREPAQFSDRPTHCMNCGVHLEEPPAPAHYPRDMDRGSNTPGDWRHHGYPGLCMDCAIGPLAEGEGRLEGTPGKPHPIFPGDKGGYQGRPADAGYAEDAGMMGETRPWDSADNVRRSTSSKTAAAGDPDFRDHIGNYCTDCGQPVHYARGRAMRGGYPWKHHSPLVTGHQAVPADPADETGPQSMTYGGTYCLGCGDQVKINLAALGRPGGGWHHHDSLKRDHPAIPADAQAVYDAIPGVKAAKDQARRQMADHLHGQFEQLSGHPLPRRPRGDEDQMPPDPFTAAKKREGGDHPFFRDHPVSAANIVAAYNEATDDEKALGDRWYADAHHVAKGIAGGNAALGAGLLSAYSPQTAWPVNMFNASRAAQGDPPGPGTGAMGSQQKPAMRILAGEHHSKVLKASKTSAFAHLIEHGGQRPEDEKNGTEKVVIDRHALSVAVGHRLTKEEGSKAPLDQPQHYEHVAQEYRHAAKDLSRQHGRHISVEKVQAGTWLVQIRKNQEEDRSGQREVGGRKDIGGGGRVKMHDNSRTRWEHHHKEHHPGAIPEENMHHHGAKQAAWTANPDYCSGCGEPIGEGLPGREPRHKEIPHLCVGCGHDTRNDPGGYELLHDRYRGVGERLRNDYRMFAPEDALRSSMSARKTAYGETRVPPQVDTLRMEECPVCGEHDVWSGDRCPVCGFVVPPSLFRDPDTSKAQEVRDQLDQQGEVVTPGDGMQQNQPGTGPDGQIGSGDDADAQLLHPDQVTPNGTPTVQGDGGPVPGPDTDGQPEDEEEQPGEPGQEPPDDGMEPQDPAAEQAEGEELLEQGQAEQEEGQEEQQQGQEDVAEGQQLEQQGEEGELEPQEPEDDLECPACGAQFAIDGAAQPGVPCPACKMAALVPLEDMDGGMPGELEEPGGEDADAEDDGGPQKDQEDPDAEEEDEGEKMPSGSKTGAVLAAAQARRVAELTARNEVLTAQLSFLASAAGVDRQLAEIERRVLRRHADVMNPASPVPDPPEAPPTQTTEEALQSGSARPAGQNGSPPRGTGHSTDDPSRPGATPGSLENVPALQTSTAITPGVELQTPAATNLIDVTAPVQGTNPSQDGGVPLEQRRIETDVRVNPDPLAAHGPGIGGQGDNGSAFPWMLDARQPQGQGQRAASLQQDEASSSQRTFASIRLAKLRVTAGLAQGDELTVAERIEKDASLPTALIEHEIGVLSGLPVTDQRLAARPVQRTAARQAPSLASVGAMSQYAPAVMAGDDLDGSDLFL